MDNKISLILACISALGLGTFLSNEKADRVERLKVEAAQARPVTDDFVIHKLIVPHHAHKATPIVTMTYHVTQPLNAGFGASLIAADGGVYCPNTSGKGSGVQLPVVLNPVFRMPLSRFIGNCDAPPGQYTLVIRFNVRIEGVLKTISVQSEPFVITD
jgi:hypothetical protein